jgi:UDP-glucose 4-epimerase
VNVLITGGAGLIGTAVTRLLDAEHDVLVVDPRVQEARQGSAWRGDVEGYVELGSWYDPGPDVIVHLASPVGPLGILTGSPVASQIMSATAAVIRLAERHPACRVINVSTSEVYGVGGVYHPFTRCSAPGYRWSRRLAYATGKLAAENDIMSTLGERCVTIRPFNVTGPAQDAAKGFVVPRMVDQALAGRPITVYKPGTQRRALLDVGDFARLVQILIDDAWPGGRVLLAGNPSNETTMRDLALAVRDEVEAQTGATSPVEVVDPVALHGYAFEEADGMTKLPDISETTTLTGWWPQRPLASIIRTAVEERREARAVRSAHEHT